MQRLWRNREGQTVVLFSGLTLLLGLGGNRLLTEVVPPAQLGELYLILNLAFWLALPTSGAYVFIGRHWPVARQHGTERRFAAAILRGLGLQALLATAGAGALWALGFHGLSAGAALALAVIATGQAVAQALDPIPASVRRRVLAGVMGLLGNPARQVVLASGFLLFGAAGFSALLATQAAYSAALACASLAMLWLVLRAPAAAPSDDGLSLRGFFRYVIPYVAGVAATQLSATAERWGLADRASTSATALFVQAVGLSTAAAAAGTSFLSSYYLPIIAQASGNQQRPIAAAWPLARKFVALTAALLLALVVFGALLAGPATRLLFGDRFRAVEDLLPWTLCGAACFALGQALTVFSYSARETLSPNVAFIASKAIYVGLLAGATGDALPLRFSRWFALSQALYAAMMLAASTRLILAEAKSSAPSQT